jgi:hypothetical protein
VENRISGLKDKIDIKEKNRRILRQDSRAVRGTHKNSVIPLKDQTYESWALQNEKRCKPKVYTIYSAK